MNTLGGTGSRIDSKRESRRHPNDAVAAREPGSVVWTSLPIAATASAKPSARRAVSLITAALNRDLSSAANPVVREIAEEVRDRATNGMRQAPIAKLDRLDRRAHRLRGGFVPLNEIGPQGVRPHRRHKLAPPSPARSELQPVERARPPAGPASRRPKPSGVGCSGKPVRSIVSIMSVSKCSACEVANSI